MGIIKENLMNRKGYTPYCGNWDCRRMPRSIFNGEQFKCPDCNWYQAFQKILLRNIKRNGRLNKMRTKYQEWIKENYPTDQKAYGKCQEACKKMLIEFPELVRTKGWYSDLCWGDREHWWLKDSNNNIIDPTAIQFPTKGSGSYREFIEGVDKVPTGKCMNCGDYCYDGRTHACSDKCEKILNAYYNNI